MKQSTNSIKIDLPPAVYGGNPGGLLSYLGLEATHAPPNGSTIWQVSSKPTQEVLKSSLLHGPPLKKSRFDICTIPTPEVPGGVDENLGRELREDFLRRSAEKTLGLQFEGIFREVIAAPDEDVPDTIRMGSNSLGSLILLDKSGSETLLFPNHSVHDIRLNPILYRWVKMPQIFLRLRHQSVDEAIAEQQSNPEKVLFESSGGLLEGAVFGGSYFVPLLSNLLPTMWGFGVPRIGQVIVYAFGRQISGHDPGSGPDRLDVLDHLSHQSNLYPHNQEFIDETSLHKATFSDAVEWWAMRMNYAIRQLYDPVTYADANGHYSPGMHQRWMLDFEQLLSRVSAILRYPSDPTTQLMLTFTAMDILGDSFYGGKGVGELMTPRAVGKCISRIEPRLPERIKTLVMLPLNRAHTATEQMYEGFLMPDSATTRDARLKSLWTARRNATHNYRENINILSEHNGRAPADIALVPLVYLVDILANIDNLMHQVRATASNP